MLLLLLLLFLNCSPKKQKEPEDVLEETLKVGRILYINVAPYPFLLKWLGFWDTQCDF